MWTYATHFICESCNQETPTHLLAACPHRNRCEDCATERGCAECRADGIADGRL